MSRIVKTYKVDKTYRQLKSGDELSVGDIVRKESVITSNIMAQCTITRTTKTMAVCDDCKIRMPIKYKRFGWYPYQTKDRLAYRFIVSSEVKED